MRIDGWIFTCVAVLGQINGDLAADAARSSHDEGYGLLAGHCYGRNSRIIDVEGEKATVSDDDAEEDDWAY